MRALTIHNPYSHLIVTPQAELPKGAHRKLVENRTWKTHVRGELAIHAGVSMQWMKLGDWPCNVRQGSKAKPTDYPEMAFGAIVGVAKLVDCVSIDAIRKGTIPTHLMWLQSHVHADGPWCFVLGSIRRLRKPVPCTGKQGFWNVDEDTEQTVRKQLATSPLTPVP
jgi:hypothetical protein